MVADIFTASADIYPARATDIFSALHSKLGASGKINSGANCGASVERRCFGASENGSDRPGPRGVCDRVCGFAGADDRGRRVGVHRVGFGDLDVDEPGLGEGVPELLAGECAGSRNSA